jgi:hypothetical protein
MGCEAYCYSSAYAHVRQQHQLTHCSLHACTALQVEGHVRDGESDRYAVVYCGATDDVGHALTETCGKLGVQFSWESFGSW